MSQADKEHRAMLLNEFIPYLKLHCNLSEMERIAGEALQTGDNLTPTETAYHTAIQAYSCTYNLCLAKNLSVKL